MTKDDLPPDVQRIQPSLAEHKYPEILLCNPLIVSVIPSTWCMSTSGWIVVVDLALHVRFLEFCPSAVTVFISCIFMLDTVRGLSVLLCQTGFPSLVWSARSTLDHDKQHRKKRGELEVSFNTCQTEVDLLRQTADFRIAFPSNYLNGAVGDASDLAFSTRYACACMVTQPLLAQNHSSPC
jgi:hypothetical protein